jgi:uncharacterized protein YceK
MKILSLILLVSLSGCASFVSGSKQSVMVVTPDAPGSICALTDSKGRVSNIENTPGTTIVKKGDGPISVICKKEGYEIGVGQIKEYVSPATAGNILFPPGFIIDSITGSSEKYKSSVEIEMQPLAKGGAN